MDNNLKDKLDNLVFSKITELAKEFEKDDLIFSIDEFNILLSRLKSDAEIKNMIEYFGSDDIGYLLTQFIIDITGRYNAEYLEFVQRKDDITDDEKYAFVENYFISKYMLLFSKDYQKTGDRLYDLYFLSILRFDILNNFSLGEINYAGTLIVKLGYDVFDEDNSFLFTVLMLEDDKPFVIMQYLFDEGKILVNTLDNSPEILENFKKGVENELIPNISPEKKEFLVKYFPWSKELI